MAEPTASDLRDVPHVVIVETETGIRLAEFERGTEPSPMMAAHNYAQEAALAPGFDGRVIVTARVRQLGPAGYALRHNCF